MFSQIVTKADAIHKLQDQGINPTQQRIVIAQLLFARPQHISADQVLLSVQDSGTHVSKATVYNTLSLFAEKGLVNEVIVDPSRVFYDSNTDAHHHFYNVDSGELQDFAYGNMSVDVMPELPQGTQLDGVDVIIRVRNSSS